MNRPSASAHSVSPCVSVPAIVSFRPVCDCNLASACSGVYSGVGAAELHEQLHRHAGPAGEGLRQGEQRVEDGGDEGAVHAPGRAFVRLAEGDGPVHSIPVELEAQGRCEGIGKPEHRSVLERSAGLDVALAGQVGVLGERGGEVPGVETDLPELREACRGRFQLVGEPAEDLDGRIGTYQARVDGAQRVGEPPQLDAALVLPCVEVRPRCGHRRDATHER